MKSYILALDQGTTSSRALLFDRNQTIIGTAQKEFTQIYPREGWVEHDPMEIYASQSAVMAEVISKTGISPAEIAAIGITNQRETTILWDRHTGKPIHNAIVWQCRRTAPEVDALLAAGLAPHIRRTTGLVPDAYFSATKIKWILDHTPGAREKARRGEILFGTVDTWLIWRLTHGKIHATDHTNASRTMLFDIHRLQWDPTLLQALGIPPAILPAVYPSSHIYGHTTLAGTPIPIAGCAGDQQAALFGQGCFEKGQSKNTYGTGCFLLTHTGQVPISSQHGLITTLAATADTTPAYALEGSVFIGGAVIQWLRDEMHLLSDSSQAGPISASVPDTGGVTFVPAFTGLGAPHWDMHARGAITGLTRGTTPAHIIRAAEESIAYQVHDLVRAIESDLGSPLTTLRVDGGATRDTFLLQFQADILTIPLERPSITESTALGAAYLAGLATHFWSSPAEILRQRPASTTFTPSMPPETRQAHLAAWQQALTRTLTK